MQVGQPIAALMMGGQLGGHAHAQAVDSSLLVGPHAQQLAHLSGFERLGMAQAHQMGPVKLLGQPQELQPPQSNTVCQRRSPSMAMTGAQVMVPMTALQFYPDACTSAFIRMPVHPQQMGGQQQQHMSQQQQPQENSAMQQQQPEYGAMQKYSIVLQQPQQQPQQQQTQPQQQPQQQQEYGALQPRQATGVPQGYYIVRSDQLGHIGLPQPQPQQQWPGVQYTYAAPGGEQMGQPMGGQQLQPMGGQQSMGGQLGSSCCWQAIHHAPQMGQQQAQQQPQPQQMGGQQPQQQQQLLAVQTLNQQGQGQQQQQQQQGQQQKQSTHAYVELPQQGGPPQPPQAQPGERYYYVTR
ncbi:hypothetical protein T492DRAFT_939141 [Pavlovales sp. CCMP2436]|nr:hypothetical protein T492DRAFT_939141 [Pavlovales sp. CCMP2436]